MEFLILKLKRPLITALTLFFYLTFYSQTLAATFFFDPPGQNVNVGEEFTISLQIDPEAELINAIEGTVEFPSIYIEPVRIETTNSIISAWINGPSHKRQTITFAGIIPGGFDGIRKPLESQRYPGQLFTITFRAKKPGNDAIVIGQATALKNDGVGSPAEVSLVPFAFNITNETTAKLPSSLLIIGLIAIATLIIIMKKIKKNYEIQN